MELTFLGTACMVPTKERNTAGYFLSYKNQGILLDCGEGTQRQMNIAGIKRTKVSKILVTHWHGDHVIGLIGLLQTIGNEEKNAEIHLYGPVGSNERIKHLMESCAFEQKVRLQVHELNPEGVEQFFENEDFVLECAPLEHTIHCLGYAFREKDSLIVDKQKLKKLDIKEGKHLAQIKQGKSVEIDGKKITPEMISYVKKGRKIAYITDTRPTRTCVELAQDADILISESVYPYEMLEKAEEFKHMTAREAAQIAAQADVKKLYLTHFSQRFKTTEAILEDATTIFENVVCAEDFQKVSL